MAKTLREYKHKTYLGMVDNERIYLTSPSWDCGWFWQFGLIGNKRRLYHVINLKEKITQFRDKEDNLRSEIIHRGFFFGFKEHFNDGTFIVKDEKDIWLLAELFETFYKLKETASILRRGHCNISEKSPLVDVIKDVDYSNKINNEILPRVFEDIYNILEKYSK